MPKYLGNTSGGVSDLSSAILTSLSGLLDLSGSLPPIRDSIEKLQNALLLSTSLFVYKIPTHALISYKSLLWKSSRRCLKPEWRGRAAEPGRVCKQGAEVEDLSGRDLVWRGPLGEGEGCRLRALLGGWASRDSGSGGWDGRRGCEGKAPDPEMKLPC